MRSCKIVLSLTALAPVLAMPAVSSWDIASNEPLDFGHDFLVFTKVPLESYDSAAMIPVASLNLDDGEFDMETSNVTTDSMAEPRAARRTEVDYSKTQVDYGCEASIRKPLGDAIHSLCGNGNCDGGSVYTRKVVHMNKSRRQEAWLRIQVKGQCQGRHARGYIADAVKKTVNDKTAKPATRLWLPTSPHLQAQRCVMSKFSNYIPINKDFGEKVHMEINVSLHTSNCEYLR